MKVLKEEKSMMSQQRKLEETGNKTEELKKLREMYVPKGVSMQVGAYAKKAYSATIEDEEGKTYIDFAGGIGVMNLGHSHPEVVEAVKEQAEKYFHMMVNVFPYEPYLKAAKALTEITPGEFPKKTLLINSGAEAVENAVKIARKYTQRTGIVVFDGAFHGRTNLAMAMTSKIKPYKYGFGPFAGDIIRIPFSYCYRCPYGLEKESCNAFCGDRLQSMIDQHIIEPEEIAVLVMEPVQGEGGFITADKEFAQKLKKTCEKYGIVFVADEIQSGFGRTGTMYAVEQLGIVPDMITTAKSIAAGLPLSAVVGKAEIMDSVQPGGIGGTYAGNPLACVAALKVIEIYEKEKVLQKAKRLGDNLRTYLENLKEKYPIIGDIRGMGPMAAIELVKDRKTKEPAGDETGKIVASAWKKGLVILSTGAFHNNIRFLMPLTITEEELEKGFSILEECFREL
jgi:4-aminobutyrate aminotransferase/(S)-3-amino-2-methylpropionate transaminase